jgi:hypothetical protein
VRKAASATSADRTDGRLIDFLSNSVSDELTRRCNRLQERRCKQEYFRDPQQSQSSFDLATDTFVASLNLHIMPKPLYCFFLLASNLLRFKQKTDLRNRCGSYHNENKACLYPTGRPLGSQRDKEAATPVPRDDRTSFRRVPSLIT